LTRGQIAGNVADARRPGAAERLDANVANRETRPMIGDDWGAADAARTTRARAQRWIAVLTLAACWGHEAREGRR
jgi:hypothetical protein